MPPNVGASSRSRNTNRRKADDDGAYVGSTGISRKRTAGESKLEGAGDRTKRKRVDQASIAAVAGANVQPGASIASGSGVGLTRKGELMETRPTYVRVFIYIFPVILSGGRSNMICYG